jgi:hypothetical protein
LFGISGGALAEFASGALVRPTPARAEALVEVDVGARHRLPAGELILKDRAADPELQSRSIDRGTNDGHVCHGGRRQVRITLLGGTSICVPAEHLI